MGSNLAQKYGRKRAQAVDAARKAKAEKEAADKKAREAALAAKKRQSSYRPPVQEEEEKPKPARDIRRLNNGIPTEKPDVTVSEEEKRKERERILQNKLREAKLSRLVAKDADTRSELLHRKSLRAAGGKKAKGADPKGDPVPMTDREFEAEAANILGLRPKADPDKKEIPWLPTDTSKKKGGYRREDFFGSFSSARSDRFQGGYRDPAFRESFIEGRMNGLKPGDAGYDRAYSAAKSAWSKAESQYDARFRDYGDSLLRTQRQKAVEKGGPLSLVKPTSDGFEKMPNGVPTATIVADVENAVANGARDVSVKIGNMTVRGGEPTGPRVGDRVGRNGTYMGNGTYAFLKPGVKLDGKDFT